MAIANSHKNQTMLMNDGLIALLSQCYQPPILNNNNNNNSIESKFIYPPLTCHVPLAGWQAEHQHWHGRSDKWPQHCE